MFQNMRYVYAVYKEGSFSRAAQKLFVTQPALSAMVRRTEDKLGARLFDRSSHPVRLTEEGRLYIEAAERMMQIERETQDIIAAASGEVRGTVRLGGSHSLAQRLIPHIVADFARQCPHVGIEFSELSTAALTERMKNEQLDLYIDIGRYDSDLIEAKSLTSQRIYIAVPESFAVNARFAGREMERDGNIEFACLEVSELSAFSDCDMLLLSEGNDIYDRAMKLFSEAGVMPRVRMYFDQMATGYRFSKEHLGACFAGDTIIEDDAARESMRFYFVNDPLMVRDIFIGVKKRRSRTAAMRAFWDAAKL